MPHDTRSPMHLVFGLGRSGHATVAFLQKQGLPFQVYDDVGGYPTPTDPIDIIVLSPGVSLQHPLVQALQNKGARITTDVALFQSYTPDARHIGITGTNGKSTTTALLTHTLTQLGHDVVMGGNIGIPALSLSTHHAIYVWELSSYQLERSPTLHLDLGIFLNMSEDHLQSHGSMAAYQQAKCRLFEDCARAYIAIDDVYTQDIAQHYPTAQTFSQNEALLVLPPHPFLKGVHNDQNRMAVLKACQGILGTDKTQEIIQAMLSFQGLEHRQEYVGSWENLTFINDSKATSAEATSKALACFSPVILLMGGHDKGDDLSPITAYTSQIQHICIYGKYPQRFEDFCKDHALSHSVHEGMDQAFNRAVTQGRSDTHPMTILLSPACASFDQYQNFEKRGQHFKELIRTLCA